MADPIEPTGGGGQGSVFDPGKALGDFGNWLQGGVKSLLGIRDVPGSVGAPINRDTLGGAVNYDFLNAVAQAERDQAAARQQQMALADLVAARARGEGPSVAQMMLQQQTNRLQDQQAGLVASQRGMNPALRRRLIMQQAADSQQQMNAQGALLRAQEQQAAQALLAQQLAGMRGQDQSMYGQGSNAALGQSNVLNSAAQADQRAALEAERLRQKQAAHAGKAYGDAFKSGAEMLFGAGKMFGVGGPPDGGGGGGGMNAAGGAAAGNDLNSFGSSLVKLAPLFLSEGGVVPGAPSAPGNSPRNDTIPAWLSPGEVVIPRTEATPERAAAFIAELKADKVGGMGQNVSGVRGMAYGGMARRPLVSPLDYMKRG